MHSASKQHKAGSFWSWCSKTTPKLQQTFKNLNQHPWSFLCPGDGLAHTWTMPSLITFFVFIPFHTPTSFPQPIFLSLLQAPSLWPLDSWWGSDVPHLLLGMQELWAALFLAQEASHHMSQLTAKALSAAEQSRELGLALKYISGYIRIWAWGNMMIAGDFNENCFGMIWLKSPHSSHHFPLNMLVHTPGRFGSINKPQSQLTWEGRAYQLETLQMCN